MTTDTDSSSILSTPDSNTRTGDRRVELLNLMLSDAARHKELQVKDRFAKVDRYFVGGQSRFSGDVKSEDKWKADTKTNHLYAFYLSMTSALMRDIPSIDPKARIPQVQEQADTLKELIRSVMLRNEFPEREEEMLYSGTLYGRAAIKSCWDKRMNSGAGDIRLDVISAKNLILQPGKTRFRDCAYMFETQMMDRVTLLLMYPEKADEIRKLYRPGEKKSSLYDALDTTQATEATHTDGTGLSLYYPMMQQADPKEMLPVVECWMCDPETIEKYGWVVEASGGRLKAVQRKRNMKVYPTGRYIRFCGNVIFEDRPNPFHTFPYSEYINMSMDGAEWPMGELDQLIPIQDVYDLSRNQLVDIMNQVAAGDRTLVGPTSGLKPGQITTKPGAWIPTNDMEAVKLLQGTRAPGEAFTNLTQIESDFDRVSGFPDIITGGQIGDLRSGAAVETMNELVRGRLKLKTYSIECAFRDMAKKITDLVGLYYIKGVHYPMESDMKDVRSDWFEYTVRAGLNLPASQRTQEQFLLSLLDRVMAANPQKADAMVDYIISQSDLPGKEELLAKLSAVPPTPMPGQPDLSVIQGGAQ